MTFNFRKNFPKSIPELSHEDKIIFDDFMKIWHLELSKKKKFKFK